MTLDRQHIISEIKTFICEELLKDPDHTLGPNTELFSSGLIDSFAMAQLGVFIETDLGVYIPDPDLTVANMDTLEQMATQILKFREKTGG